MSLDLSDLTVSNNPAKPPAPPAAAAAGAAPDMVEPEAIVDAEPPPLTPQEKIERHKTFLLVQQYLTHFPHKLGNFEGREYDEMTKEELDTVLVEMRMTLQAANSISLYEGLMFKGIELGEMVLPRVTPLRLEGLTLLCRDNQELTDSIKELALEAGGLQMLPPHIRLTMSVMQLGAQVHMMNTANLKAIQTSEERLEEVREKFADL